MAKVDVGEVRQMAIGLKWKRRRDSGGPPGSDLSDMTDLDLIDVTLVTEFAGQSTEVPKLGLGFAEDGVTVRKPDGAAFVRIPWGDIVGVVAEAEADPAPPAVSAVSLDVESSKRHHLFVVPNAEPGALAASLGVISHRYGGGSVTVAEPGTRASKHSE